MAVSGNEDNDRRDGWQIVPLEPPRPGPDLIESDTWGESGVTTPIYAGRHHNQSRSRVRLLIGVGVVALAAAAVIPLALGGSPSFEPSTITDGPGLPPLSPLTSPPADSVNPGALSSQTEGGPTPTAAATSTSVPTSTTQPPASPKPSVKPPPPFTPITIEAEAGAPRVTLGGSAWGTPYDGASGGSVVRNVGDWDMRGGPGTVQFNGLTFPTAGSYVLVISFVHPDNEPTRSAQITVSGVAPITVSFAGNSRCCSVKEVTIAIPAGTRTITIANAQGRAPAIDKVTIRRA